MLTSSFILSQIKKNNEIYYHCKQIIVNTVICHVEHSFKPKKEESYCLSDYLVRVKTKMAVIISRQIGNKGKFCVK